MNSVLSRFFPVPRYLAMHGGGIEISDRSIKYLELARRGTPSAGAQQGTTHVVSFGEVLLPQGSVVDGLIKDRAVLAGTLKEVRRRCRFSLCHASLPESKGYLFTTHLPLAEEDASETEMKDALALALSSHVPLSPAEAVFDCELLPEESASPSERAVVAGAFPEELALAYAEALGAAQFLPLSFELEPQAAARAVANAPRTAIIADLGETKTMLCVVENGRSRFTTSGEGSQMLDSALLAQGLGVRDIARVKADAGLLAAGKGAKPFLATGQSLAGQISRLTEYWNAHGVLGTEKEHAEPTAVRNAPVAEVILYGGNANIKGLPEYLSRSIGLPVRLADVWKSVGLSQAVPPLPFDKTLRFATVAGLALRGSSALQ